MPKSRNRKNRPRYKGKGPRGPIPSFGELSALARSLDSPEMRELYRRQKSLNPNLDGEIDEAYEKLKEVFNHGDDSK